MKSYVMAIEGCESFESKIKYECDGTVWLVDVKV